MTSPPLSPYVPVFTNDLDVLYNGVNVDVRFTFHGTTMPSRMPSDFTEIVIVYSDLSNTDNPPVFKKIIMDELNEFLSSSNNYGAKYYSYTFKPEFKGKLSSQILISANVNYEGGVNDIPYPDVALTIPTSPEAPVISLVNPLKFIMNPNGPGVKVVGDVKLKIAPPSPSQIISKYKVTLKGQKLSGDKYFNIVIAGSYADSSSAVPSFPLEIPTSSFPADITPDSSVYIYLQYEGNDRSSELSNRISAKATIRLDAPVITAVTSMQDGKITVAGTVKQAPYTEASASATTFNNADRIKMTILAVETQENEIVSEDLGWVLTDQQNLLVKGISGPTASQNNVPFSYEISNVKVNGALVSLKRTKAYRFVAVAHYGDYDPDKKINIALVLDAPKINQSPPSNMDKTGLCIQQINSDIQWTNTQSTAVVANVPPVLTFTPTFAYPAYPANVSLPPAEIQQMIVSYSFSSKQKGLINNTTIQSSVYEVAPAEYWKVSNPLAEDVYTLEAKFEVYVPADEYKYIQGTPVIPLVKNESNVWVAILKTFSASVEQTRSSSDVPSVKELSLYTQLLGTGNTRALVSSHKSYSAKHYADKQFTFKRKEHQMIQGIKSTNPADFRSETLLSFNPSGLQTHSSVGNANANNSSSSNLDHPEDLIITLYPIGTNSNSVAPMPIPINTGKLFSSRVRTVVLDLKSGAELNSDWVYAFHEVAGFPPMNAPLSVSIDDLPSDKPGYALRVFVSVAGANQLANKPVAWGSEPVIPLSFKVELVDQNRESIGSGPYTRTFTSDELYNYNADSNTPVSIQNAPLDIFGLTLEENSHVYAKATITYALASDKSKKSEGSGNDINATAHLIPPTMVVSNIKLVQNPPPLVQGPRAAVDASGMGMINLTVYADVDTKGLSLSDTIVQCYLNTANGIGPHAMSPDGTDATKMRWKSESLLPDAQKNYQREEISVLAINSFAKFPLASSKLV